MTLMIPDDILKASQFSEQTLLIELACHLFDKQRLNFAQSARMAGLTRTAFEDELHNRAIPIYRMDVADFEMDLQTLRDKPLEH